MTFKKAPTAAEESSDAYQSLMCIAHGCPNRWSVDGGKGRLCSKHAWVPASTWGEVTRNMASESAFGSQTRQIIDDQKFAIIRKAYEKARDPNRAWAEALRAREQSGERLTSYQKSAWREGLGVRDDS